MVACSCHFGKQEKGGKMGNRSRKCYPIHRNTEYPKYEYNLKSSRKLMENEWLRRGN